jgi:hypothetical protein
VNRWHDMDVAPEEIRAQANAILQPKHIAGGQTQRLRGIVIWRIYVVETSCSLYLDIEIKREPISKLSMAERLST